MMEASSCSPGKFVLVRMDEEHLQCIAVVNFKGGSAKTTTAANLTQYLALHGYRTLAIDLDPCGFDNAVRRGSRDRWWALAKPLWRDLMAMGNGRSPPQLCAQPTFLTLDLVPAGLELMEMSTSSSRDDYLAERGGEWCQFLRADLSKPWPIATEHDVVVIDCPP